MRKNGPSRPRETADTVLPQITQTKANLPHASKHCTDPHPDRQSERLSKPWRRNGAALHLIRSLPSLQVCRDEDCRQCVEPQPQLPVAGKARPARGELSQRGRGTLLCRDPRDPLAGPSSTHAGRLACKPRVRSATLTTSAPHRLITSVMGTALPSCSTLTNAAAAAATLNCKQPSNAEALPARAP